MPYTAAEMAGQNTRKRDWIRDQVLSTLVKYAVPYDGPTRYKLFTMPSGQCDFEKKMLAKHPDTKFAGVECKIDMFLMQRKTMPGGTVYTHAADIADKLCTSSFVYHNYVLNHTDRVTVMYGQLNKLLIHMGGCPHQAVKQLFGDRNGAWFDLCGPLSKKMLDTIRGIKYVFNRTLPQIPVLLTMEAARERPEFMRAHGYKPLGDTNDEHEKYLARTSITNHYMAHALPDYTAKLDYVLPFQTHKTAMLLYSYVFYKDQIVTYDANSVLYGQGNACIG